MTTLKTTTPKMNTPPAAKRLDVRLRKIRSFKTSSLKSQPPKMVLATVRAPKPFLKSIVPYGLVIASLALCTGATASAAQAKTAQHPAHAVTHVARQRGSAQQPDFVAQFFQGLFGGRGVPVRASRGAPDESTWVDTPSYDNSAADAANAQAAADNQAASDAEVQAIQQMNDINAMNASMAAAEQQNEAAQAAAIQTEINANN
jgi:hypothetical protein